jgi:hypothetical protein
MRSISPRDASPAINFDDVDCVERFHGNKFRARIDARSGASLSYGFVGDRNFLARATWRSGATGYEFYLAAFTCNRAAVFNICNVPARLNAK